MDTRDIEDLVTGELQRQKVLVGYNCRPGSRISVKGKSALVVEVHQTNPTKLVLEFRDVVDGYSEIHNETYTLQELIELGAYHITVVIPVDLPGRFSII